MDRKKYCNELNRETFLTATGYKVISFAYDDVAHRPDLCKTFLRMLLHQYDKSELIPMNEVLQKEIIRLAASLARPLRPVDVKKLLAVNHRTIVKTLQILCDKGIFKPEYGRSGKYIVRYSLLQLPLQQLT
ncbi:hypothetical protein [Paenibacillus sp. HB172176]|uniref:hypothetical protein n=1 Tax=Paenibacillus sp. HB172176 TaxID=2493690 RepID=UPI001439F531|nr:hypothetical protein [Paenibacillus sp. HB172176]